MQITLRIIYLFVDSRHESVGVGILGLYFIIYPFGIYLKKIDFQGD